MTGNGENAVPSSPNRPQRPRYLFPVERENEGLQDKVFSMKGFWLLRLMRRRECIIQDGVTQMNI